MKRFVCCSLVAAALALLCGAHAFAGGPYNPACNCVPISPDLWWGVSQNAGNLDSVSIDTCGLIDTGNYGGGCLGYTYNQDMLIAEHRYYSKIGRIEFAVPAIPLAAVQGMDTILEVSWMAINTQYPILREEFKILDSTMGGIIFRKTCPQCEAEWQEFTMIFKKYFNTYDMETTFPTKIIKYAKMARFTDKFYRHSDVGVVKPSMHSNFVFPNPVNEVVTLETSTNGNIIVTIYSPLGEIVYSCEKTIERREILVDVNSLQNGLYFIRINNNPVIPFIIKR
jgi:hypothetical protein